MWWTCGPAARSPRHARGVRPCCWSAEARSAPNQEIDHGDGEGNLTDPERDPEVGGAGQLRDERDDGEDGDGEGDLDGEAPGGGAAGAVPGRGSGAATAGARRLGWAP